MNPVIRTLIALYMPSRTYAEGCGRIRLQTWLRSNIRDQAVTHQSYKTHAAVKVCSSNISIDMHGGASGWFPLLKHPFHTAWYLLTSRSASSSLSSSAKAVGVTAALPSLAACDPSPAPSPAHLACCWCLVLNTCLLQT